MSRLISRAIYLGDPDDGWALDVALGLPPEVPRFACPGDLPARWPGGEPPDVALIHRTALNELDADRLARLRVGASSLMVVLVVGPHVRYHHCQRWLSLVDTILPEATARDVIGRWVEPKRRPPIDRPSVAVVSERFESREVLAQSCRTIGYEVRVVGGECEAAAEELILWDVPALEPLWGDQLERIAATSQVLALLGLADRESVRLARSRGAAACLNQPCDLDDLAFVLDRLARGRQRPRFRPARPWRHSAETPPPRPLGNLDPCGRARSDRL